MEPYRATAATTRSKDATTHQLRRYLRKAAPRKAQRQAAIAVAATVPLTDKQREAKQ